VIRPLRFPRVWLGLGGAILLLGLVLSVIPLHVPLPPRAGDKVLHFVGFACLTVWFFGVFRPQANLHVALGLFAYGALIEVLQSFTANRFAEAMDLMFNVIGIATGWLVAWAGLHGWCETFESWFGADPAA
jgi:VanZ family protein